ncbi:hypothetical protein [Rhodopila sp.]|jgi:phospholipase/carboxylesterase|uniref:hypothetical protein n=1 Tax=Rhodopila sp. TaxID=2480087 RepID=UPI002CF84DBE|nr:hypothetical protein [Rhodopila sp.]HVZ08345.1 hypothetical protein [Rhodopila sp.]
MAEGQDQDGDLGTRLAAGASVGASDALFALMDALGRVSRAMYPPCLPALAACLDEPAAALSDRQAGLDVPLRDVAALALRACEGIRQAGDADNPMLDAYRALRLYQRALALLVEAERRPEVSRFLLPAAMRGDAALAARLALPGPPGTGVSHHDNDLRERGGYSVYVPPALDGAGPGGRAAPLVVALHGGLGHGRLFLSNWVPLARVHRFIVVAPTAVGSTWSLMEPQVDVGHIAAVLDQVGARWRIDPARLLLTGMSDGGTFTLLSGLDDGSPFTHLAPVAASFHPMLLAMTDPRRVARLPIYLVHGALDWMFPVGVARSAERALTAAGAAVTYREIADLSHAYPTDEQAAMLAWFLTQPARGRPDSDPDGDAGPSSGRGPGR